MQQVNLLPRAPVAQQMVLSTWHLLAAWGGCLVVMIALSIWASSGVTDLETERRAAQQKLDALIARQNAMPVVPRKSLQQEVLELRARADAQKRVLDSLVSGANGGFGQLLEGLARAQAPKVWLTRVETNNLDERLELEGFALDGASVTRFVQALSGQPGLRGRKFADMRVASDEGQPRVRFVMTSTSVDTPLEVAKR